MQQLKSIATNKKTLGLFIVLTSLVFTISGSDLSATNELNQIEKQTTALTDEDLAFAAKKLQAPMSEFLEATEATKTLYRAGKRSIPFLIAQFSNKSTFSGYCGFNICSSEYVIESPKETILPGAETRQPLVQEVSLYLLVAILKPSLCFAYDCLPIIDNRNGKDELDLALGEVAILYVDYTNQSESFDLKEVEGVLAKYKITFSYVNP